RRVPRVHRHRRVRARVEGLVHILPWGAPYNAVVPRRRFMKLKSGRNSGPFIYGCFNIFESAPDFTISIDNKALAIAYDFPFDSSFKYSSKILRKSPLVN